MNHTMLSRDLRPICQLIIADDRQMAITVGRFDVTRISAVDETGEMAYVPWFEVWKGDKLYCRVNARYVSQILYQEGQPVRGDTNGK